MKNNRKILVPTRTTFTMHYTTGSHLLYNANISSVLLLYPIVHEGYTPNILGNKYCDPKSLKTLLKFFLVINPKLVFTYKTKNV